MLDYVTGRLASSRGKWPEVSAKTGVPYHTISKIASGVINDPGVRKIEILADYFRKLDEQTA